MRVIVLGCGNLLSYDEGVGIHAIRILREGMLPPEVELMEVGKPGVDLVTSLENCRHLIIIDAMAKGEKPPGTVHRFDVITRNMEKVLGGTVHGFNLILPLKLIHGSGEKKVPSITLLAMEIKERTIFGVGLSPEVKEGLEYLLDMTWHELSRVVR